MIKDDKGILKLADNRNELFQLSGKNSSVKELSYQFYEKMGYPDSTDDSMKIFELKFIQFYLYLIGHNNFVNHSDSLISVTNSIINPGKAQKNLIYQFPMVVNESLIHLVENKLQVLTYNNKGLWAPISISGDIKSYSSESIKKEGLFFMGDGKTFLLLDNKIFSLQFENNILSGRIFLNNVPLDKSKNLLSCGTYSAKKDVFAFGSSLEGLYIVQKSAFNPRSLFDRKTNYLGSLSSTYTLALLNNDDIRTSHHLVYKKDQSIERLNIDYRSSRTSVHLDNDKNIWYWTPKELCREDSIGNIKKFVIKEACDHWCPEEDGSNSFFEITPDHILVPQETFIIEVKNDIYKVLDFKDSFPKDEVIKKIFSEGQGELFLLCKNGIYTFNLEEKKVSLIPGTQNKYFRNTEKTSSGNRYVFSHGSGFFLFKNNELIALPLDQNRSLLSAHTCELDYKNNLWISSNNGLYRVNENELMAYANGEISTVYYQVYDTHDGFYTNEFNGGPHSSTEDADAIFSFSNLTGILQFSPKTVDDFYQKSDLSIGYIFSDTKKIELENNQIYLNNKDESLEIRINIPYYHNASNLRIEYKLSDNEEKWSALDLKHPVIKLESLDPGYQTLTIRKRESTNQDQFDYVSVKINVKKAFYAKSWFRLLTLFVVVLLLILLLYYYDFRTNFNSLISDWKTSKSDLIQINSELEKTITKNDFFVSALLHDVKTPLHYLQIVVSDLNDNINDQNILKKKENIETANNVIKRVNGFISEILNFIKLKTSETTYDAINLKEIVEESFNEIFIEDLKPKSDVAIIQNILSDKLVTSDERLLKLLLRNLLENAYKYTHNGSITISIVSDDHSHVLKIADTGEGMSSDLIERINTLKYLQSNNNSKQGHGLGYIFITEIAKMLQLKLSLSQNTPEGTIVSIKFAKTTSK